MHEDSGLSLGEALARVGLSEEGVARFLAGLWQLDYLDLDQVSLTPEILALVPPVVARSHRIIPVARDGRAVVIATADPDIVAMDEVRTVTSLPVKLVIATASAIQRAIRRHYGARL